jgi:hypothetical protein
LAVSLPAAGSLKPRAVAGRGREVLDLHLDRRVDLLDAGGKPAEGLQQRHETATDVADVLGLGLEGRCGTDQNELRSAANVRPVTLGASTTPSMIPKWVFG